MQPHARPTTPRATHVREASFDLLRAFGLTTVFGNPGSTELSMFLDVPPDFRYVLGLQESVVVGMADGYAQATRNAAFVNLHSAVGVGHAMGAITDQNALNWVAPSIIADSSISLGISQKKPRSIHIAKGWNSPTITAINRM